MFQSYFQHGGLLSQLLDHKGAQGAHRNQQDPAIRRIQQVHLVRASGETLEDWKPCTSKKRRQHSNSRSNGAEGIYSHIALVNALPRMRLKSVESHKHVRHLNSHHRGLQQSACLPTCLSHCHLFCRAKTCVIHKSDRGAKRPRRSFSERVR